MKNKILISTGGSGGHVVPALTFYEHLKDNFDVFLSSDLRGSKFINNKIENSTIIDVLPLTRNIFLLPWRLFIFFISIVKSVVFLRKNKIKTVISTGGYMSLPICIGAKFINCKIILFEPNMVLGRANLFFLKKCSFIFCYSKEIINFPENLKMKIKVIPPILRKKIYYQKKIYNKKFNGLIKILIIGGSQGADFFQNNLKNSILNLSKKFKLKVIHQTNKKNEKNLEEFYQKNKIKYELFDFKEDLINFMLDVNFCITRAGASSLAELVHINLPFIAIPFPYAKDNHQYYNALFYKNLNCCWILEQNNNITEDLDNIISNFISNENEIYAKVKAMEKISFENSWNNINHNLISIINEN